MVTTLYAGILALLYVALSLYVIKGRFKYRVSLGNGGEEDLESRIRAHGNFVEYIPFVLILMILSEFEGMSEILLHILGLTLIIGRIFHINEFCKFLPIPYGRPIGMVLTFLVVIITALYCIKSFFVL